MQKLPSRTMRDRARQLRGDQTVFERRLWYRLKILNEHGAQFRRQVPFANYILDFADHSARLVIELDGSQHGEAANRLRDEKRDSMLTAEGYLVLRFANHEIVEDADAVAEAIERIELQRRRVRPGATGVK
jgi:very-short-patch-repair endonuclease